jgi:hypothetical protein
MSVVKKCLLTGEEFIITDDEIAHIKKMSFKFGGKTVELPLPNLCPDERAKIRTAYRNEQFMYQRKSDLSDKQLISVYSADKDFTIYSQEEWNSDNWDAMDYGRDFDFSRPFFEQFAELDKDVPKIALVTVGNENSPYTTGTGYCKNCHLINSSEYCEDCYYGKLIQSSKSSVDCSYLYNSELCYQCFSVNNSYSCVYLSYSQNCSDCWFSENLNGCKDCFLCTNLTRKQYCFMNEQLTKEEYEEKVKEFKGSHQGFIKALEILADLRKKRIYKYANIVNSVNCTGDFIENSKNCNDCYDVNDSEDCKYVRVGVECKDCYDCSNIYIKPELSYHFLGAIETFHVAYCVYVFHSQNIIYSHHIHHCSDLFGCVGLKRKKFCILNKQYTEEEYNELVPRIVEHMKKTGEWGYFFPPKYAPFGYNETLSNEYYPMSKEQILRRGWLWHEESKNAAYQGQHYVPEDNISDVDDEITKKILECEVTGKLYKVIPQELKFYRQLQIPIPRKSPDQRHIERMQLRNTRKLYQRNCDKCQLKVESTYAPNRPETIYCEQCYLEEIS